jgi:Mn2+/Fe2+ NRAMP family transporter
MLPWATFRPVLPEAGVWSLVALLVEAVVPYNLFLHARAVQEMWPEADRIEGNIREARWDAVIAIALGGVVTAAILLTALATFYVSGAELSSLAQMADQLVPVAGGTSKDVLCVWFVCRRSHQRDHGTLGRSLCYRRLPGVGERLERLAVSIHRHCCCSRGGSRCHLRGRQPRSLILFAKGANGLLLPVIAVFLIIAMNRSRFLGNHVNGRWANLMGGLVVLLVVVLAGRKLYSLWAA